MKKRVTPFKFDFPGYRIFAFESKHSPEYAITGFDVHDFCELCFISKGKGRLNLGHEQVSIEKGAVLFFPAGTQHRIEDVKSHPVSLFGLCFYDDIFSAPLSLKIFESFKSLYLGSTGWKLEDPFRVEELSGLFRKTIFEQTEQRIGYESIVFANTLTVFVLLSRAASDLLKSGHQTERERAVQSTLSFIQSHFTEPLTVALLARMAGQSYRGYTGKFKSMTGKGVSEYLTSLRLDYARKRLLQTRNIVASAFESGFNDIANFYKCFKKRTGRTPRQFILDNSAPVGP